MKKPINPTPEQIREIAQELDCGMDVYYHLETGEIKTLMNYNSWEYGEPDEEMEEFEKYLEDHRDEYLEFEVPRSSEVFRIMSAFADFVEDRVLGAELILALNRPRPFANFKWLVDNSGPYRKQWFEFKRSRYEEYVKEIIDDYNQILDYEEEED